MTRLLVATTLLSLIGPLAGSAAAQPESVALLEDLRAGMASTNKAVVEETAGRVERVAKTIDRPERLLPLVEAAVFSGRGTFEYGVVFHGDNALAQIAARASAPGPVLDTIARILARMKKSQTRDELAGRAFELVRRFPTETLARTAMFLLDADPEVRSTGWSLVYTAGSRLSPAAALTAYDALARELPERLRPRVAEAAAQVLARAQRVPMGEYATYRATLDGLIASLKSPVLVEVVRRYRSELTARKLEWESKADRFATYRRLDGSLEWGKLVSDKLPFTKRAGAEHFSAPRRGAAGEVITGFLPEAVATEVFKTVHQAAIAQVEAELATATGAQKQVLQGRLKGLEGLSIRYLNTNDIVARRSGKVVEISQGLLHEVYARSMRLMETKAITAGERGMYQARVLGLVFAHETAHAAGLKAERVADAQAVRTVWSSILKPQGAAQAEVALQGTLDLFARPTGAKAFDNLLYRLRSFFRYGTPAGRLEALRRASKGQPDPLARFRRADGTIDWKRAAASRGASEAAGLAKFGLALFLKELALVAQTGDRARIEEFFEYVLTTDFYKHYGLFVAGARLGEVAYGRYLQRFVKPRFINGVLKTNLALAAGMALPMLVEGNLDGKTFAISFASLGISSALVSSTAQGIRWLTTLKQARGAGLLARFGPAAGRLARVGGWFYTVGELAVVLYLADRIEGAVHDHLERREARDRIGQAGVALTAALRGPTLTADQARAALQANHDAWIGYRDTLFQPLIEAEAKLALKMAKAARDAKLQSDERATLLRKAKATPAIKKRLLARYGTLERYAAAREAEQVAALQRTMDDLLETYAARRAELLREVYQAERRDGAYLTDFDPTLLDVAPGRDDVFARWSRSRAQAALTRSLSDVSDNRLQAYADERALLARLARNHTPDSPVGQVLTEHRARVERLHQADVRLSKGEPIVDLTPRGGAIEKVRGLGD